MTVCRLLMASMLVSIVSAGGVIAQTTQDHSQPSGQSTTSHTSDMAASGSVGGATKQRTQGLPAGTKPTMYGSDWAKQQSATKQQ